MGPRWERSPCTSLSIGFEVVGEAVRAGTPGVEQGAVLEAASEEAVAVLDAGDDSAGAVTGAVAAGAGRSTVSCRQREQTTKPGCQAVANTGSGRSGAGECWQVRALPAHHPR